MIQTQTNRVKIEGYETGWVITIKEKNWTKIGEYSTPCLIKYNDRIIELYNDYLVDRDTIYKGEEMKRLLPNILENGVMEPKY